MNVPIRSIVDEATLQILAGKGVFETAPIVEPQMVKKKYIYPSAEACLYINKSRWILKRLVDLRLLKPRIFISEPRRHFFFRKDLDRAMSAYIFLKKHRLLNKLPLCACVEAIIEEQAQNALKCA